MPIVWDIGRATASPYHPSRAFRFISPRRLYACWLYPLDLVWAVCPGEIKVDPFTGLPDPDGERRRCGDQYPVFYDRGSSARETVCPSPFCNWQGMVFRRRADLGERVLAVWAMLTPWRGSR